MMRNAARLLVPATNLADQKITALLAAAILMAGASRARADQTLTLQAGDNYVACQVVGGSSNNIVDPLFLNPTEFPSGFGTNDIFSPVVLFLFPHPCNGSLTAAYFYFNGDSENPPGWYDVNNTGAGAVSNLPWNPGEGIIIRRPPGVPLTMTLTIKGAPRLLPLAKALTSGCVPLLGSQVLGADTFDNITGHPASFYSAVEVYRYAPAGTATLPGNPPGTGGWDLHTAIAGVWSPPFPALYAAEAVVIRVPSSVIFQGLLHTPLGDASLTVVGNELTVGNLGSSGQDGVSIALGGVASAEVGFAAPNSSAPVGAILTGQAIGTVNATANQPLHSVSVEQLSDGARMGADFSALGATMQTIQVLNQGVVVYNSGSIATGGARLVSWIDSGLSIKDYFWYWWANRLKASFAVQHAFTVPASGGGTTTVLGDEVVFQALNPTIAMTGGLSAVAVTGSGMPGFTIKSESVESLDYAAWGIEFSGLTDTAPGSDPDGDGMTNQQEYAFGLNPASGTSVTPIINPFDKTTGKFSYTRRHPALTGLVYTVQTSTDLEVWTDDTVATAGQTVTAVSGVVQTVEVMPITPVGGKLFMRVKAE